VIITSDQWIERVLWMERSVQIKVRIIWKSVVDEDSIVIVDNNDIEPKVVDIDDAQYSIEVLSFMAS
jgi:hypothetical protein